MSLHRKSSKQAQYVKIANPQYGCGTAHTSLSRARRFVKAGRAKFDAVGRLVFLYDEAVSARKASGTPVFEVTAYDGFDARPGMPVLPPSPEVLAKLNTHSRFVSPAEVLARIARDQRMAELLGGMRADRARARARQSADGAAERVAKQ